MGAGYELYSDGQFSHSKPAALFTSMWRLSQAIPPPEHDTKQYDPAVHSIVVSPEHELSPEQYTWRELAEFASIVAMVQ